MKSDSGTSKPEDSSNSRTVVYFHRQPLKERAITDKLKIQTPTHPEVGKRVCGTIAILVALSDGEIMLVKNHQIILGVCSLQHKKRSTSKHIIPCWYRDRFNSFYKLFGIAKGNEHAPGVNNRSYIACK